MNENVIIRLKNNNLFHLSCFSSNSGNRKISNISKYRQTRLSCSDRGVSNMYKQVPKIYILNSPRVILLFDSYSLINRKYSKMINPRFITPLISIVDLDNSTP